jgi:hypothetical protein
LKILLDEGVPRIIQKRLSQLSISNVEEMGWRGIKNGALLDLMAGQFQILITTDKNLPSQQNLENRQISLVILPPNDVPSVIGLLPQIERALANIPLGESPTIAHVRIAE